MDGGGTVFNIQRYSLHDGPGIRTVVFLKGCPLRCAWCCNPESQRAEVQIGYDREKCLYSSGCRRCEEAFGAPVSDGNVFCLSGADAAKTDCCPTKALFAYGAYRTVKEVLDICERDEIFYGEDGGITLSGGEPFFQRDFALALLSGARERLINTAAETAGAIPYPVLREAAPLLDYLLYDIKHLDASKHKAWTGADNRIILENFDALCKEFPTLPKKVRTPIINGFNDGILKEIAAYAHVHGADFEALPFHAFGTNKYACLKREYAPHNKLT
ncbi:MAG: glycyl-radical enzyme activating protein [Clostridiaceae bacterium]|jgi:pyruvate formate lyase activating enzyme|nr:glycyl-radical enzyme activating protein [Clostridiaceae bacterium]